MLQYRLQHEALLRALWSVVNQVRDLVDDPQAMEQRLSRDEHIPTLRTTQLHLDFPQVFGYQRAAPEEGNYDV